MRIPRARLRDPLLVAALAGAYGAFALTFLGPRDRFWHRMTRTGAILGSLALAADPAGRRLRFRWRDVAAGVGSAAVLYGVFRVGDRLARRVIPKGGPEIGEVYALRAIRPRLEIAARLMFVIAPAEELFWRGFVQGRLTPGAGLWKAAALAAAAYGGAHAATGNATLIGAATVAGAFWSGMAAAGLPMAALVASHVAWDVWIFLIAPTGPS